MMRGSFSMTFLLMIMILVPSIVSSRHIRRHSYHYLRYVATPNAKEGNVVTGAALAVFPYSIQIKPDGSHINEKRITDTVQATVGSRLPDCTNACGSCKPCRLVMVSFVCATLEEAETCPMAYKCMCNHKSYPVPRLLAYMDV